MKDRAVTRHPRIGGVRLSDPEVGNAGETPGQRCEGVHQVAIHIEPDRRHGYAAQDSDRHMAPDAGTYFGFAGCVGCGWESRIETTRSSLSKKNSIPASP